MLLFLVSRSAFSAIPLSATCCWWKLCRMFWSCSHITSIRAWDISKGSKSSQELRNKFEYFVWIQQRKNNRSMFTTTATVSLVSPCSNSQNLKQTGTSESDCPAGKHRSRCGDCKPSLIHQCTAVVGQCGQDFQDATFDDQHQINRLVTKIQCKHSG